MRQMKRVLLGVVVFLCVTSFAVFAAGNKEVPEVQVRTPSPQYLSPNGDGIKDTAQLSFRVTLRVKSKQGFVPEYGLAIENASGAVVRTLKETEKSDLNWFMKIFTGYKQFTLEKTLTWDGKNDSGQVVPDGRYKTKLYVIDENGNRQSSDLIEFVVDTHPPTVALSAPDGLLFSPNGDGNMDTLRIRQSGGTVEKLWRAEFTNASGTAVRTLTWENSAPASFSWDGKDSSGAVVPDGTYTYSISSTDQAGNKSETYRLTGIIVDTKSTPVSVTLTNPYMSPNGDGVKDTTTIELSAETKKDVAAWRLRLDNALGSTVRQIEGKGSFPSSLVFDGKDTSGRVLPNGTYQVVFRATLKNGNVATDHAALVINTTPPVLAMRVTNPYISPNGDGVKDTATAHLSAVPQEGIVAWGLSLEDAQGNTVRQIEGQGLFPPSVTFDGKDSAGQKLPNGPYRAIFHTTSRDGNSATTTARLVINTTPPALDVTLSTPFISPNGDGVKDSTTASLSASAEAPFESWTVALQTSSGATIGQYRGDGRPPQTLRWDGRDRSGQAVGEGSYRVVFSATALDGTSAEASAPLQVDVTPPTVNLRASTPVFTPNSTGAQNTEVISISANEPVTWQGTVADNQGRELLATTGPMSGESVTLDRTQPGIASAPNGIYTVRLRFTDRAGNSATAPPLSITVITRPISTTIAAVAAFSPNGDGTDDLLPATISTTSDSAASKWDIAVLDSAGKTVADYPGSGALPPAFRWNGVVGRQNGKEVIAADGTYRLLLRVAFANGLDSRASSKPFLLDTSPPVVHVTALPGPFILTGGGIEGSVSGSVEATDAMSGIAGWTAEILGPSGNRIRRYSGEGDPSQALTWRGLLPLPGKAPTEVTSYPYGATLTVRDSVGNETTVSGRLYAEVIAKQRADGKMQMLVPNILFGLYKYAIDSRSPEQGVENMRILRHVVSVMKKYPSYDLEVDGYSMEIYKPGTREYDREEAIIIPLSRNRAQTARNALIQLGMRPERIVARHFGGLHPLVDPLNEGIRWQNRRVEFILLPK